MPVLAQACFFWTPVGILVLDLMKCPEMILDFPERFIFGVCDDRSWMHTAPTVPDKISWLVSL